MQFSNPNFSIITVCLNSEKTIKDTVFSVKEQIGVTFEHIIKDGGSTDGTLEIVSRNNFNAKVIKNSDAGVYDAMNQGFEHANGELIAFLNSDDYYPEPQVLKKVYDVFKETDCDIVFGDIEMANRRGKIRRVWQGRPVEKGWLASAQLPHPAVFIRKSSLLKLERPFDISYVISADLKQQLILVEKQKCVVVHLPECLARMRLGGLSTGSMMSRWRGFSETARAYREVRGEHGWSAAAKKVSSKLSQIR